MLVQLLTLVALGASCVLGSATPTVPTSLNPPVSAIDSSYHPISQVAARGLTNAKRLASGLPLKPPTRRHGTHVSRAQPSGVAPNQGCILAKDGNGNPIGYVKNVQNAFGEYVIDPNDTNPNDRLVVAIDLVNAQSGSANIQTVNGPDADLPFFGGIAANSNNLELGLFSYVWIGGTVSTLPNSPAILGINTFSKVTNNQKAVESAIWTLDSNTYKLTPQWINADGSCPTTYLGLTNSNVLVLTGDISKFVDAVGLVTWVTLYFVPA